MWDEHAGWQYDEELAAKLIGNDADARSAADAAEKGESTNRSTGGSDEGETSADSDSEDDEDEELRRQRRARRRPPRIYPRSTAQRLVDEAEDSVEGARPIFLDLSGLAMARVSSRVYDLYWLERLSLSTNRLSRISPDLSALTNLVDLDLRHNR